MTISHDPRPVPDPAHPGERYAVACPVCAVPVLLTRSHLGGHARLLDPSLSSGHYALDRAGVSSPTWSPDGHGVHGCTMPVGTVWLRVDGDRLTVLPAEGARRRTATALRRRTSGPAGAVDGVAAVLRAGGLTVYIVTVAAR